MQPLKTENNFYAFIWSEFQIMQLNETTKIKENTIIHCSSCKNDGDRGKQRYVWSLVQNNFRKGDPQTKEMIYLQERKWVHDTYV